MPARLLLLCCILLTACGGDPELPPAMKLTASPAAVAALYGVEPGPNSVATDIGVVLAPKNGRRELTVNLYYPEQGEDFPLLLFSHGNWSDRQSYDRIIRHWVSHGYVVIATDHLDCCSPVKGIFHSLRLGQYGLIEQRVTDLQQLLSSLQELADLAPGFRDKADAARLAITGHSFGAFTAQQFAGAAALNPNSGEYQPTPDGRVSAVIAMNPPGPMFDTITSESWRGMSLPTLVSTGTWDIQPRFWPDWRMHLMSYENSPAGDKYALVTQGADHYLGNLICRTERDHAPQTHAMQMLMSATTAFLDAKLRHRPKAIAFINGEGLTLSTGGFATISRR